VEDRGEMGNGAAPIGACWREEGGMHGVLAFKADVTWVGSGWRQAQVGSMGVAASTSGVWSGQTSGMVGGRGSGRDVTAQCRHKTWARSAAASTRSGRGQRVAAVRM
jgi:hypothetical protein